MIDTNVILHAYLAASGTALHTLVGGRVWPRLPSSFGNTQAALECRRVGGGTDFYQADHYPRFQIKCFGGTNNIQQAEAVYRALYDRLHGVRNVSVSGGVLLEALQEFEGQTMVEQDTGWPFVLVYYSTMMRGASI